MKVLVPVDGSELAEGVLIPAVVLAGEDEITLVRVASLPSLEQAEGYLEEQRERLETCGVTAVRWCLEEGDPAERILVIAEERKPDVIVMATEGWGRGSDREEPSVAEQVLQGSHLPLFLCTPRGIWASQKKPFASLLVPIDGTKRSDGILYWVERLVAYCPAPVTLLHVAPGAEVDRKATLELLEPQRARLADGGIETHILAAAGDPVEEILAASEEFDLVCMATHGRTGLARWWFGSVAEKVLERCEKPLLMVRSASTPASHALSG